MCDIRKVSSGALGGQVDYMLTNQKMCGCKRMIRYGWQDITKPQADKEVNEIKSSITRVDLLSTWIMMNRLVFRLIVENVMNERKSDLVFDDNKSG